MADKKLRLKSKTDVLSKVRYSITNDLSNVFWYIKFNTALDPASVSGGTMNVTDTEGYIMRTDISYDANRNLIVISPMDSYLENVFYILNIAGTVRSDRGRPLKDDIHILFKLMNARISQFEMIKPGVKIPRPVPRPKDYDDIVAKKYGIEVPGKENRPGDTKKEGTGSEALLFDENGKNERLLYKDFSINVILAVIGALLVGICYFIQIPELIAVSLGICFLGIGHIIIQLAGKNLRSTLQYNRGVSRFNKQEYEKALVLFKKANAIDKNSREAHHALTRTSSYL